MDFEFGIVDHEVRTGEYFIEIFTETGSMDVRIDNTSDWGCRQKNPRFSDRTSWWSSLSG